MSPMSVTMPVNMILPLLPSPAPHLAEKRSHSDSVCDIVAQVRGILRRHDKHNGQARAANAAGVPLPARTTWTVLQHPCRQTAGDRGPLLAGRLQCRRRGALVGPHDALALPR